MSAFLRSDFQKRSGKWIHKAGEAHDDDDDVGCTYEAFDTGIKKCLKSINSLYEKNEVRRSGRAIRHLDTGSFFFELLVFVINNAVIECITYD